MISEIKGEPIIQIESKQEEKDEIFLKSPNFGGKSEELEDHYEEIEHQQPVSSDENVSDLDEGTQYSMIFPAQYHTQTPENTQPISEQIGEDGKLT